ncbi:MAG: hypothetical protein LW707_03440 [Sphingobacteriales bacterium]|nr:hypothetical protein [Sphingobacteriales bacterium]
MPSFRICPNRIGRLLLVCGISAILSGIACAQTTTISPYSRFGPGELLFNGFAWQRAMGGTAVATEMPGAFNLVNPATYDGDSLKVFEFGLSAERIVQQQSEVEAISTNARLEYFAIGLPFKRNRWGLAFGFVPYSGTGYSVTSNSPVDSLNSFSTEFSGAGGINRYFISNGFRVSPAISVGLNTSYVYGTTDRSRIVRYADENFFDTRIIESTTISGFLFDLGLMWRLKLKNDSRLTIGAACGLATSTNAERNLIWDNFRTNAFGVDVIKDTIVSIEDQQGEISLPLSMGFGIQWNDAEHWVMSADYRMQDWTSYSEFGESVPQLDRSYRISVGAQYTNDAKASAYFRKVHYRGGLFHSRTNILLRDRHVDEYGLSIGFGLPLRKAFHSQFNVAIEALQRGTVDSNLVRERYLRLVLGLTFNEGWFQKRRYD